MSRHAALATLGVALACVLAPAACTGIVGVTDVQFADAGDASATDGATAGETGPEAPTGDAPADHASPETGGPEGGASCAPTDVCAPPATAPWSGPVALYDGTSAAPSCGGAYAKLVYSGHSGLTAPAPTCMACTCGSPTGLSCPNPVSIGFVSNQSCTDPATNSCGTTMSLSSGSCAALTTSGCPAGNTSFVSGGGAASGSCAPSGGAPTVPPVSWAANGAACGLAAAPTQKCGGGGTCVPAPSSSFGPTPCVYQTGVVATCPVGYPNRAVLYDKVDDSRGCSACSCGFSGICNATVQQTDSTCTANYGTSSVCGTLVTGTTNLSVMQAVTLPSCGASGGQPVGNAAPDAATAMTVCCSN